MFFSALALFQFFVSFFREKVSDILRLAYFYRLRFADERTAMTHQVLFRFIPNYFMSTFVYTGSPQPPDLFPLNWTNCAPPWPKLTEQDKRQVERDKNTVVQHVLHGYINLQRVALRHSAKGKPTSSRIHFTLWLPSHKTKENCLYPTV